jgi:hypothetical protein
MVFNTPIDFIRFLKGKELNSPVLNNLEAKRRASNNCCKCVRGQRVREFLDFYYSMGNKLSDEEKALLKQAAGDNLIFKNGDNVFLEIK